MIVYNIDRLTRQPAYLERFYEVVRAAHVDFLTRDTDRSTADGLMMARILGAFVAKESANFGRRISREMEQVAAEGRPHVGSNRPFGYAKDKTTVVPEQASIIRTLVSRFLARESLRSVRVLAQRPGDPSRDREAMGHHDAEWHVGQTPAKPACARTPGWW